MIFLIFLIPLNIFANSLKVGDLLLQPLHCRLCNLIEGETHSEYSHIGIVLQTSPQIFIGEAFKEVRAVSLEEFLKKTEKGLQVKVLRHRSNINLKKLKSIFIQYFQKMPYDRNFLWGNDSFYCSEFTWKILKFFTKELPSPKPMTFYYHPEEWEKYFNGPSPVGKRGISPADFDRSIFFRQITLK